MGAQSVIASKPEVENMRQFGEYIGIAFQIKDDLFDYGAEKIENQQVLILKNKK